MKMRKLSAKKPPIKRSQLRGVILYDGPSMLDGEPIVVIATLETSNRKTGQMVQTWIIRSDIAPTDAAKNGKDKSICGSCPHRHYSKGVCYVNLAHAPLAVYKGYQRGIYPAFDPVLHGDLFAGRKIRLGAYGDPAAAPFEIMEHAAKMGIGHTGYTHQIQHKNFDKRYLTLCQVSADSPKQALKYQALGANTFRVAMEGDSLAENEIECLSDSKGMQCIDCMLCDGSKKNIALAVHGTRKSNFKTQLIQTVEVA